jgi:CBS domain-containing protein
MRVSQILPIKRRDLVSVAPSATVRSAIALMQRQRVGAVLLLDEEQRLLGVLSERDIVHGLATAALGLLERPVSDVAHTDAPVATPEDTVQSIMELMTVTRARHVPVVQFGRVVGIVSIGDIVKSRLDEKTLENVVLQEIARAQFFAG